MIFFDNDKDAKLMKAFPILVSFIKSVTEAVVGDSM